MRSIIQPRRRVEEVAVPPRRIFPARLAEEYDGIGQYVLVSLAGSAVGGAYKARIGSGDFNTGQTIPAGTKVSVFSNRGQLEILTLGAK